MKRIILYIASVFFVLQIGAQEYQSDVIKPKPKDIDAQKALYNSAMLSSEQGLHTSVDLSAFATFGSGAPHKGGFAQDISMAYLAPLTKNGRLWIDAGGYVNNIIYGGDSYRDVGLHAVIDYHFDEHLEAYLYGQLSIANNYGSYYNNYGSRYNRYGCYNYYDRYGMRDNFNGISGVGGYYNSMGVPGANVVGVGATYHVNKNFSFGINVERVWYNNRTPYCY